jgi:copper oxidase (laccase) domain-containing protein
MKTPLDPTPSTRAAPGAGASEETGRTDAKVRAAVVRDVPIRGFPAVRHPEWDEWFPWLVQGTTVRTDPGSAAPFDLRLFGPDGGASAARPRWERLLAWSGLRTVVHARQIHGAIVLEHAGGPPGLSIAPDADGHVVRGPGVLVTASVADCVPVSIVDAERRAAALLHAGWRGTAAGILEAGLDALVRDEGRDRLYLHFGPSVCGRCYEVGPEVFEALGYAGPAGPTPIDLRAALAERAAKAGVSFDRMSTSAHCTRCGAGAFFSHRGGDSGRQVGFLGLRS